MNSNYHKSNLDSWTQCNVGDICSFEYGKSLTKANRNECGIYPVVGSSGIVGKHDLYLCEGPSIVVGRKGAAGEVTIVKDNFWPIDTTYYVKIPNGISLEYVYYLFKRLRLNQYETSTAIPGLNRNDIYQLRIQIPPLPEQRQIVAKIEELFSELDKSVELLKTLQQQLKVYRQAVLEKYTNLGNKIAIKDCITDADQGWSPKCLNENTTDPEVWAVISTTAIQTCKFNGTENKILPDNLLPRAKHEIQIDDILITRAGPRARCGVSCLVKNVKPRLLNCDKVYRLKIDKSKAIPQFIEYVLNSPSLLKEIENCKTGGNDSGVNLTKDRFLNLLISLPSIEKQKYSIAEIASRLSVADKVEETIDQSLQQAEALRQSILKKAFEGRLLSTAELEEIRQEPDWEPASVLLERIKAQKSAPDVSKPPAKQSSRKGKKHS